MGNTAGKGAVRCRSLDMAGLAAAESHGKRRDKTSKLRVIRDASPLVYKGLDLRPLYDAHVAGAKRNKGAKKPVLHFIVRFPPELLDGAEVGRFKGERKARQLEMAKQAVRFINQTHGGQAVFAARVDRDEAGETVVDVFAAPKYEKRTKRTRPDETGAMWISATKFGVELAEKHQDEIRRRLSDAKAAHLASPRAVGMALQSEFAAFFKATNGIPLTAKKEKTAAAPDRLEVEAYKEIERRRDIQARWDQRRGQRLDAKARKLDADRSGLDVDLIAAAAEKQQIEDDRRQLDERTAKLDQRETALRLGIQMFDKLVDAIAKRLGEKVGRTVEAALSAIRGELDGPPAHSVADQIEQARAEKAARQIGSGPAKQSRPKTGGLDGGGSGGMSGPGS